MSALEEALSDTIKKALADNLTIRVSTEDYPSQIGVVVEVMYDGELIDDDYVYIEK